MKKKYINLPYDTTQNKIYSRWKSMRKRMSKGWNIDRCLNQPVKSR